MQRAARPRFMRHSANRRHALRFARGGVFGSERDLSVFLTRAKGPVKDQFLIRLAVAFPDFAAKLGDGVQFQLEEVHAPASESDLRELEKSLGLPLPESYKSLLRCAREFWLLGGLVKSAARSFTGSIHSTGSRRSNGERSN